jgi:hypothetical protein
MWNEPTRVADTLRAALLVYQATRLPAFDRVPSARTREAISLYSLPAGLGHVPQGRRDIRGTVD